jgi:hypothetical protein
MIAFSGFGLNQHSPANLSGWTATGGWLNDKMIIDIVIVNIGFVKLIFVLIRKEVL